VIVDVAMPFEDIHYFQDVIHVTKEDDVSPERERPDVRTEFRTWPSQRPRQLRQMATLVTQCGDKASAYGRAVALTCNILQDFNEIGFG
jgi:hypothetical protein